MPRLDLIDRVIAQQHEAVSQLIAGSPVMATVSNIGPVSATEMIGFQVERTRILEWASSATDEQIAARIKEIERDLTARRGPGALAQKYRLTEVWPLDDVLMLSQIELLEIALGTHPAVMRDR